jgi:hypothetical protein
VAVRLRNRQRHDARLTDDRVAVMSQRHVAGLQRRPVVDHDRRERGIHETLDRRDRPEARGEVDTRRAARYEQLLDRLIGADVRAAEPVDRLLRIADDEELARRRRRVLPAANGRVRRRQQQDDLRLQRVGVLELVHEDVSE